MNNWLMPSVIGSLLSTLLLTSCYAYLYRKEKLSELKLFFIAWLLYSCRFICKLFLLYFQEVDELIFIIYILTLFNGALLFIASRQLLGKRPRKIMNIILLLSFLIVPFLQLIGLEGVINTSIVFLFSGVIYILVGVNFIRQKSIHKGLTNFIGVIFILWGIHKFDYPFLYDSVKFAPFGYLMGAIFSLTSALCILMLYYEIQKQGLYDKSHSLEEAKNNMESLNHRLTEIQDELKIKIDYILGSEMENKHNLEFTDLINIDVLQRIQDSFAEATGVGAIITSPEGVPFTKPSNFSEVCQIVRQSELGLQNCIRSDMKIGEKSARLLGPVYEECQGCGFIDAASPIIIGNKHLANWMIGQVNIGNNDAEAIGDYAEQIGVDRQKLVEAFYRVKSFEDDKFDSIVNLLWVFSQELSAYAYNNILLAKKIEEHKRVESDLIQEQKRSEEHDRLKDTFLSNMSHEIRTPLNGILGFSELLRSNTFSEEQRFNFIELIEKSGKRLLNTIEDIINISIIQTGQLDLNRKRFNINSLIEDVNGIYKPFAEEKGLKIEYDSDRKAEIFSDKEKIEIIIAKLIDNAIKFTDKGKIVITCRQIGSQLSISVQDSGIGISEDKHIGIFRKFEQGDNDYSRKYEGLGLGLSIAKAYSEALGGNIIIEPQKRNPSNKPVSGTKVTLILPN